MSYALQIVQPLVVNDGLGVLAFDGGKTLLLDREDVESLISENKFLLMGV